MANEKLCPVCGKMFVPKSEDQYLCSLECVYDRNDEMMKGYDFRQFCTICGKEFYKQYKSPFCSNECRQVAVEKEKRKVRKLDSLDAKIAYCKKLGISYSDYQKMQTLSLLEEKDGQG